MKTLLEYYTELLEAQDYEGMFRSFLDSDVVKNLPDGGNNIRNLVNDYIKWARRVLKKNDRIVWFLRWVRVDLRWQTEKSQDKAIADLNKILKTNYTRNDFAPIRTMQTNLEHFMQNDSRDIQNIVFDKQTPGELFNKMQELETQHISKAGDDAGADEMYREGRLIEQNRDDKIVIKFPDGYAWIDLETPADDDEGEAMGHCGNRASYKSDETILSLRKLVNYKGKKWWYPVCTFILDGNGRLGEMKGRANKKPQVRYHDYIIALLKRQDIIKGIKGGGYMPSQNFSMSDLSEEERDEVEESNPNLETVDKLWAKEGMTKRVLDMVYEGLGRLNISTRDVSWLSEQKEFEVYEWSNFEQFLRSTNDRVVYELLEIAQGEQDWQPNRENIEKSFAETLANLEPYWQEKILKSLGIEFGTDSDFADAARTLIKTDDFYWRAFEELLNDEQAIRNMAWERIAEYVGVGWYFPAGGVEIPSDVEKLKEFVTSDSSVKLLVDARTMVEIASTEEEDDYYYEIDVNRIADGGWDLIEWDYIVERRKDDGLLEKDNMVGWEFHDSWLKGIQATSWDDDYVAVLSKVGGKIDDDPRQGKLLEAQLQRLKFLGGIQ